MAVMPKPWRLPSKVNDGWSWLCIVAALQYIAWCSLLGFHLPGLEYDEAISMRGAMEMCVHQPRTTFSPELSFCVGDHCARLMVAPYVGAAKDYFLLPIFWLFGPSVAVGRFGAALIVALAILGIAFFIRHIFGGPVSAVSALVLAVHPAMIDLPLYDNGNVALTFFAIGLIAVCLTFFLKRGDPASAFFLGAACGFAIWCRMNLLWLVLAAGLSAVLVLRRSLRPSLSLVVSFAAGGFFGAIPLLLYVAGSINTIGQSLSSVQWQATAWQIISYAGPQLAETLLSDPEHRSIWMGPAVPLWQLIFIGSVAATSLLACLIVQHGPRHLVAWRRIIALTAIFYLLMTLASRTPVAGHHLVALVPFVAILICAAPWQYLSSWQWIRPLLLTAALIYFGLAGYWNLQAAQGIRETNGTKSWSNAVLKVSDFLQRFYPGSQVKILDWGLAQNLYFLSETRIPVTEIFWNAPLANSSDEQERWDKIVKEGGLFLTNAPSNLHFPAATRALLNSLGRSGQKYETKVFHEKTGAVFAVLYDIPN